MKTDTVQIRAERQDRTGINLFIYLFIYSKRSFLSITPRILTSGHFEMCLVPRLRVNGGTRADAKSVSCNSLKQPGRITTPHPEHRFLSAAALLQNIRALTAPRLFLLNLLCVYV